jgi:predicted nucleic acid-binding protein
LTACYLDASAIVKLAIRETETDVLRAHLTQYDTRATSRLATVEVPRALARRGADSVAAGAEAVAQVLGSLQLVELDAALARHAAELHPTALRSLDAIHLASALALGEGLGAVFTYDARLASAARAAGLTVIAPA